MIRAVTLLFFFLLISCNNGGENTTKENATPVIETQPDLHYGIDLNHFELQEKKIRRGDTFGKILEENGIDYPDVYSILQAIKGKVNVRKLNVGKPYSLFYSKDSLATSRILCISPWRFSLFCHSFARQFVWKRSNKAYSNCRIRKPPES